MIIRINMILIILLVSSSAQKHNPPADWMPVKVGRLTVSVPADMTEQQTSEPTEKQRIFDNGRLSISISYGNISLDDLMLIMHAKTEFAEEVAEIDGKKVHVFTFLMTPITVDSSSIPPRRSDPNKLLHRAVAYFPKPLQEETHNFVMWAECEDAAGQKLAKQIFHTARFQSVEAQRSSSGVPPDVAKYIGFRGTSLPGGLTMIGGALISEVMMMRRTCSMRCTKAG